MDIAQWLAQNRTERRTKFAMNHGARALDVIKWLHDSHLEGFTADATNNTAGDGNVDIVQWLHHNRLEGCTSKAMDKIAKYGHLEVVRFLHEYRILKLCGSCMIIIVTKVVLSTHWTMLSDAAIRSVCSGSPLTVAKAEQR